MSIHKIHFRGASMSNNSIIANGWQTWGKCLNVLRVIYNEKRHPVYKYFLMEKIGRRWYEYGHYRSLEEAVNPETIAYKRQMTTAPAKEAGEDATLYK